MRKVIFNIDCPYCDFKSTVVVNQKKRVFPGTKWGWKCISNFKKHARSNHNPNWEAKVEMTIEGLS